MTIKIAINLIDATKREWEFTNIKELRAFIQKELDFWINSSSSSPLNQGNTRKHPYFDCINFFQIALDTTSTWEEKLDSWDDQAYRVAYQELHRNSLQHLPPRWIWSGHPFTAQFIDCQTTYGLQAASAFSSFVIEKKIVDTTTQAGFIGTVIAYEFLLQGSEIAKRRTGEKKSISQLRNNLDSATSSVIRETDELKTGFKDWLENKKTELEALLEEEKTAHTTQLGDQRDKFSNYMDTCSSRIQELENLYQEKLRLEKPAQYWRDSAKKYGLHGALWALALIAAILLGLVYFHDFFTTWLQGKEVNLKLNTLQGVVIFGSIVAVYAFLARTLAKLTFSSFHLMRDAEEREQLTYLYLSLSESGKIDESSRDIILQALFSRSDTGLLSSDSGPTMPGIVEAIRSGERPNR
nr:DUF6161 domain-containing protein [Pseudomonas toyotomiensis]